MSCTGNICKHFHTSYIGLVPAVQQLSLRVLLHVTQADKNLEALEDVTTLRGCSYVVYSNCECKKIEFEKYFMVRDFYGLEYKH
jgi:hypothetical protein